MRLTLIFRTSSSYVTDPQWARKFTIAWTSVAAAGVIVSLPHFYRSARKGRIFAHVLGVTESWKEKEYVPVEERQPSKRGKSWKFWMAVMRARAIFDWTLPGFDISVGQSEPGLILHSVHINTNYFSTIGSGIFCYANMLHLARIRALRKLEQGW